MSATPNQGKVQSAFLEVNTVQRNILNQNFVPIVDGRNTLCGILTRRGVICYLDELVKAGKSTKE